MTTQIKIVLGSILLLVVAMASAQTQPVTVIDGCTVELLEGSFGYAVQALTLLGPPATQPSLIGAYTPLAFAGTVSFDGKGNLHGADMVNSGFGGIPRTFTGTYGVFDPTAKRKDCAFTSTFTDTLGNTIHTYMVVVRDGKVLKLVNTDPNFVLVLEAEKK